VNGAESFVDPTVVYFERPDDEQQIAHPAGGDSCTALYLSEAALSQLWGGEPGLPDDPLATDANTDLRQRLLLAAVERGDSGDVEESMLDLAVAVLAGSSPERLASGRPATAAARRRVVSAAREALASSPRAGVIELARRVAVSPHHLSRVFKAETGLTISRYRNRLRVRLALSASRRVNRASPVSLLTSGSPTRRTWLALCGRSWGRHSRPSVDAWRARRA
jgi:AraC-like DNA-binding protein